MDRQRHSESEPDPLIGRLFDQRYEVIERIGEGGMATVYRARQLAMERMVALKVVRPERASDETAAKRFHREMKATSRIVHPNTVSVFDYGSTEDGTLFLAMEILNGEDLNARIGKGRLSIDQALAISRQVLGALAAAHKQDVIHRDLKPENIMLVDLHGKPDHVKVLDFGIATFAATSDEYSEARVTGTGVFLGTPSYVSPEQIASEQVDQRSDLYSFGVLLFEMITGHLPFEDKDRPLRVLNMHMTKKAPAPSSVTSDPIPPWIDDLVGRLLSKYPDDRPSSADEVIAEIDQERTAVTEPAPQADGAAGVAGLTQGRLLGVMVALVLVFSLLGVLAGYVFANLGG